MGLLKKISMVARLSLLALVLAPCALCMTVDNADKQVKLVSNSSEMLNLITCSAAVVPEACIEVWGGTFREKYDTKAAACCACKNKCGNEDPSSKCRAHQIKESGEFWGSTDGTCFKAVGEHEEKNGPIYDSCCSLTLEGFPESC